MISSGIILSNMVIMVIQERGIQFCSPTVVFSEAKKKSESQEPTMNGSLLATSYSSQINKYIIYIYTLWLFNIAMENHNFQ